MCINNFTTKDGYEYVTDTHGIIHQKNIQPFTYDKNYVDIYRSPEYREASSLLMGIRVGSIYSNYFSNFGNSPLSILDIGYGDGSFLKSTTLFKNRYGFDVTNESVPEGVNKLEELNNSHYDVITMWDVYEHIEDLSFINNLNFNMICFSMPDVEEKDFETWTHRKPNEHIHHFTPSSLEKLMDSYGLKRTYLSWQEDVVRKSPNPHNIMTMFFTSK